MNASIIFHPLAEQEFRSSFLYYEAQLKGLGFRFEKDVDHSLKKIAGNPEHFGFDFGTYRKAALINFPFVIVYRFNKEKILFT